MKSKVLLSVLLVGLLLPVFTAFGALNQTWHYNDDFTKVTVDGKEYDNFVVLWRQGDQLFFDNRLSSFFAYPHMQEGRGVAEILAELTNPRSVALMAESTYPAYEIIAINHVPWQETEYAELIYERFEFYKELHPKGTLEFIRDKSNNGYADLVLSKGVSPDKAKQARDIGSMLVWSDAYKLCRNSTELAQLSNLDKVISKPQESIPTLPSIPTVPSPDGTRIRLHINEQAATVNGRSINLSVAPLLADGKTYVPLRGVVEHLGGQTHWRQNSREAVIRKDGITIVLPVGHNTATVNGKEVKLDQGAKLINGYTMIPLRFVADYLDCNTHWDQKNKAITIETR